jgi:hypothetical protein
MILHSQPLVQRHASVYPPAEIGQYYSRRGPLGHTCVLHYIECKEVGMGSKVLALVA